MQDSDRSYRTLKNSASENDASERSVHGRQDRELEVAAPMGSDDSRILADYARTEELAEEFEVSKRTIQRWVRLRLLPAPKKMGKTSLHHVPTIREHIKNLGNPTARRRGR